ncbi:MAG: hypothetical protein JWO84_668 [Parcubacteria group bacterium]|nr:hypothetical protein [Parcubacteria group bacterium]
MLKTGAERGIVVTSQQIEWLEDGRFANAPMPCVVRDLDSPEVRELIDRFKGTVCRYPEEFVGHKRAAAVTVFKRHLKAIDPHHRYLVLREKRLVALMCAC